MHDTQDIFKVGNIYLSHDFTEIFCSAYFHVLIKYSNVLVFPRIFRKLRRLLGAVTNVRFNRDQRFTVVFLTRGVVSRRKSRSRRSRHFSLQGAGRARFSFSNDFVVAVRKLLSIHAGIPVGSRRKTPG